MDWFRSHHGAPTDPKWQVIARRAKVTPAEVVALFWLLLDYASQHEVRGTIEGFDVEVAAMFLGVEDDHVSAILQTMRDKGILTGDTITNWHKRQPKRERDDDSSERVQRWREKARAGVAEDVTPRNATVTPRNAQIRTDRQEQTREEQTDNPPTPQENVAPAPVSQAVSGWREGEEQLAAVAANLLAGCPEHWEPALIAQYRGARNVSNPAKYLGGIVTRWKRGENVPAAPPPPKTPPPRDARRPVPGPMTIPVATLSPLRVIAGDSQ